MSRDYYYELDALGNLRIDGTVQTDPWFVDFFFRRLAPTANPHYPDYPYVTRCGDEMNYLKPADTPIVYTGFDGVRLYYAHSLNVPFHPNKLSYSENGVLYHWAHVGERGRIIPQVAMAIAHHIEPWGPYYAFRDQHRRRLIPLTPIERAQDITFLRPKEQNQCVVCGEANPNSFLLTFVFDHRTRSVRTYIRPDERMQGSLGSVHGGSISQLLDETMGKCISVQGIRAPTAQLNVRFRSPMVLEREYEVRANIRNVQGRKFFVSGEILDSVDSSVVADAEALFIAQTTS